MALCAKSLIVLVICLMATIAICLAVFEFMAAMAFFAGGNRMLTDKWKQGHVMIKADLAAPAFFIVTALAMFTLLASMYVVYFMTAQAISFEFVLMYLTLVTGVACQFLVFSPQFKLGITVMRELAITPAFRAMTALTFISILCFMHIV